MSSEPWLLTIVRLHGLRFLRPEKSWRPIVTVDVDHHSERQTVLGCDGQNINLKEQFCLYDVDINSRIDIRVWRKSESKKKGKKRQLTGSTSLTLGELLKKQGASTHTELRLNCMNFAGKRPAKGQPQTCATLTVRLRTSFSSPSASSSRSSPYISEDEHMSHHTTSGRISETLISDADDYDELRHHSVSPVLDGQPNQLRRRRLRAYKIDSDNTDEDSIDDEYSYENEDCSRLDDRTWDDHEDEANVVRMGTMSWIGFQLLPRYANQVSVPSSLWRIEAFVNRFSPYQEMVDATSDDEYQDILDRLKIEWRWGMNILMGLCGLNATVFGFSPDVIFAVDSLSKKAIAVSGVSSGLGLVLNFWYQFLYMSATGAKFQHQARDTFGTYFFFCMCCRLPTFLMFLSSCALLGFMLLVSFDVWPQAVMIVSFSAGVLVSLQYLLFGLHRFILGIRWVFRKIGMVFASLLIISRQSQEISPATNKPGDKDDEVKSDKTEKQDGVVVELRAIEEGEECD